MKPCPAHGTKHFLYAEAGPCVHPLCVRTMFRLWGAGSESGRNIFLKWEKSADDVVSWVVGHAVALLGHAPASRAAWGKALRAYEKHLAKEAIRAIVLPEVDLLMGPARSRLTLTAEYGFMRSSTRCLSRLRLVRPRCFWT